MARDKILTLTPEQHKLLGHALALAHAVHSQMGGNGLGVAPGELPAIYDDVDIYVQPGAHGGRGFFSTLGDAVSKGVRKLQSSSAVRLDARGITGRADGLSFDEALYTPHPQHFATHLDRAPECIAACTLK